MISPPLAVIFDLFYTLIDMRGVATATSTSEMLGIDSDLWSRTVMEASPRHALGSDADPVESVRKIAHAIDPAIPLERIRAAAAVRPARFREALLRVDPEALAALARLRAAGLRIGLISNAGLDEIDGWDESPLAPLFDEALFSCHEKLMKPEAEIYLRAARRLGVAPARCFYIGDGGSREHEGANAVGMRTVLFLGLLKRSYPDTAARRPRIAHWTIESFAELIALVEHLREKGLD
jgi:putative hydrolase of the HAD superfamily